MCLIMGVRVTIIRVWQRIESSLENVTNGLGDWIIWNGCRWGSTTRSFLFEASRFLCLLSQVFPASFQLFVGPLGDISIRVLICECLPGIFFFIRCCSSIRSFVLNYIVVFLNTGKKNLLFIWRISYSFCHN